MLLQGKFALISFALAQATAMTLPTTSPLIDTVVLRPTSMATANNGDGRLGSVAREKITPTAGIFACHQYPNGSVGTTTLWLPEWGPINPDTKRGVKPS